MIRVTQLESGVRLVTEKIPYVRSVSIGIWAGAGAATEPVHLSGISHFTEHMMFKGTTRRTAFQIAEAIDSIGGTINAFTGKEATCYYVKAIDDTFEEAADVLVDMILHSEFAEEEMKKERSVILEEIKMSKDNPDELAVEEATDLVFRGQALGNSVLGTKESLDRIDSGIMRAYVDSHYTPDRLVISVAGNFSEKKVHDYFENAFSEWKEKKPPRGKEEEKLREEVPAVQGDREQEERQDVPFPFTKLIKRDIEQSHLCMATKGMRFGDKRYFTMSILNNTVGGSMSSRLFQHIREDKGLAYSVYSMTGFYRAGGYFAIYAGVSHDKVGAALEAVESELRNLKTKGIGAEELESSRAQMKASYLFSQESTAGRMFKNGKNVLLLDRTYDSETLIRGFDQVTMKDIDELKELICSLSTYSIVGVTTDEA